MANTRLGLGGYPVAAIVATQTNIAIEPGSGNLVLSESSPDFLATFNREITPDSGNLVLSESSLNLVVNYIEEPNNLDLVFSTYVPNVVVNYIIEVPKVDLSLTQSVPDILQGVILTPNKVDLVFSGSAPNLSLSNNITITPDSGNLNLSQSAPNVVNSGLRLGGGVSGYLRSLYYANLNNGKEPRIAEGYALVWGISGFGQVRHEEVRGGWAVVSRLSGKGSVELGNTLSGKAELDTLQGDGYLKIGNNSTAKGWLSLEIRGQANVDNFIHGWGEINLFASGRVEAKSNYACGRCEISLMGSGKVYFGNVGLMNGRLEIISGQGRVWHDPDEEFLLEMLLAA